MMAPILRVDPAVVCGLTFGSWPSVHAILFNGQTYSDSTSSLRLQGSAHSPY
jgi:hypothetical protein